MYKAINKIKNIFSRKKVILLIVIINLFFITIFFFGVVSEPLFAQANPANCPSFTPSTETQYYNIRTDISNNSSCNTTEAVYDQFVTNFANEEQCQTFCLGINTGGPLYPNNICKINLTTGGSDCFTRKVYDGCPSLCNDLMSSVSSQLPNSCDVSGTTYNLYKSSICSGSCTCSLGYYVEDGGSGPTGVDLKISTWNRTNIDGPGWSYGQGPYTISWSVSNATSCNINGTNVSTSGGSWNLNMLLGQTTANFVLSCSNADGTSTDSATVHVPPAPTNPAGSCPSPGTTGTFSWTAPTQNVGGISSWNTFYTRARTGGVNLGAPAWDDNFVGTSKSFSTTVGSSYDWWLHTKHIGTDSWSDPIGGSFGCIASLSDNATCSLISMSTTSPSAGQTFTGTVTMLNSGQTTWVSPSQGGSYRLVSQNPQGNSTWGVTQVDVPISTLTSARYVRINVPSTNSWVSVNELEIYDTSNNRILPISCSASATYSTSVCGNMSDSNLGSGWNSGNTSAFVTVDLGSIRSISRIRAYMSSSPSPTNGTVQIQSSDTGATYTTLRQYTNYATATWYQASYGDPNRSTTFSFTATAPSVAGTYNFDFGMSIGGSAFGQICSLSNVNVGWGSNTLTVTKTTGNSGTGTVTGSSTPSQTNINCGSVCSRSYSSNTTVTLTASPSSDSYFVGWSGACSGTGSCVVSMNQARNVTATFNRRAQATISANPVNVNVGGSSTITWSSSFATSCTVTPNNWTGTSGSRSTGALSLTTAYTVTCQPQGTPTSATVNVSSVTYNLTVIKSGQGTVTSSPSGINCGPNCTNAYNQGTTVVLSATPSAGRIFTGWSGGGCTGRGTCTTTINGNTTIIANFAIDPNYREF